MAEKILWTNESIVTAGVQPGSDSATPGIATSQALESGKATTETLLSSGSAT